MARPSEDNPNGEQVKQAYEKALTDLKIQKLLKAIEGGLNRDTAIAYAGLSRSSVYSRMDNVINFRTQIEDAEEYWFAIVENEKNKKIAEGYWPAIEKELKSKKRDLYGDKSEVDQKTTHLGDIKIKLPDL